MEDPDDPTRPISRSAEDDGDINKAKATGIAAGSIDAVVVEGFIGDGPFGGPFVDGFGGIPSDNGDYDWYKLDALAGQTIEPGFAVPSQHAS